MTYTMHTPSATRLKNEIIDKVSAGADARTSSARLLPEGRKNGITVSDSMALMSFCQAHQMTDILYTYAAHAIRREVMKI